MSLQQTNQIAFNVFFSRALSGRNAKLNYTHWHLLSNCTVEKYKNRSMPKCNGHFFYDGLQWVWLALLHRTIFNQKIGKLVFLKSYDVSLSKILQNVFSNFPKKDN